MKKILPFLDKFMMSATFLLTLPAVVLTFVAIFMSGIIPALGRGISDIAEALVGIPEVTIPIIIVFGFIYLHSKYANK